MSDGDGGRSPDDPSPDDRAPDPDATSETAAESDGRAVSDPAGSTDSDPAETTNAAASEDDAPLSDLANRVRRQPRDRTSEGPEDSAPDLEPEPSDDPPPESGDDPFDRMSVGEIDEETLWSSLGSDDAVGVGVDADPLDGADPASGVDSVGDAGPGAAEHVVTKDTYCQSCPYLDEPPELACTHEGTEIVEVVDSERFRVRNCPMVEAGVEPTE